MQAGECRHRNSKLRHTCPVDGGKSFRICSVWVGLVFQEHLSHRICVRLQNNTQLSLECHVTHTSFYAPANRCIQISLLAFNFSKHPVTRHRNRYRKKHAQKKIEQENNTLLSVFFVSLSHLLIQHTGAHERREILWGVRWQAQL